MAGNMAAQNSYHEYKRDTSHLVRWLIETSNIILKSSPPTYDENGTLMVVNTTGKTSVAGILIMAKIIAKHINNHTPPLIYRLLRSVIKARSSAYESYQRLITIDYDEVVEKSNLAHKHFIDTLTEAFEALGGNEWMIGQAYRKSGVADKEDDHVEQITFQNMFSALNISGSNKNQEEAEEESSDENSSKDPQPVTTATGSQKKQRRMATGKGKKDKKRGKAKKKHDSTTTKTRIVEDIPVESYRIIEDQDGLVTDYLIAVYEIVREWMDLRSYIQKIWREVAYDGLNGAVAGAVSTVAVSIVRKLEFSIFLDFPGHDSYDTIMKTITRGDPIKAQTKFSLHELGVTIDSSSRTQSEELHAANVDVMEQFMIYTYQDLFDFITDFQKNRTGQPTKSMKAQLNNWNPNFNLQLASKEERIKWRRSYTINWLYDLVSAFLAAIKRNHPGMYNIIHEDIDWSLNGPRGRQRGRPFALSAFAGEIFTIAMQKSNKGICQRILPHHIFHLQCIVDSFTISRGWSVSALRGDVFNLPAPDFGPRRDIKIFLNRAHRPAHQSFVHGMTALNQMMMRDVIELQDIDLRKSDCELTHLMTMELFEWLEESRYLVGDPNVPPSRFSNSNPEGLWEYSPFLCGVGLMEGLEFAYCMGMVIWERTPELMLLMHLHNMLVQTGYITEPLELFTTLGELFPTSFFVNGQIPTSKFAHALSAQTSKIKYAKFTHQQIPKSQKKPRDLNFFKTLHIRDPELFKRLHSRDTNFYKMLNLRSNHIFQKKVNLPLYREAGWDPSCIPEDEIPIPSLLALFRLGQQTKKDIMDPVKGQQRLENTGLAARIKTEEIDEQTLLSIITLPSKIRNNDGDIVEAIKASLPSEYRLTTAAGHPNSQNGHSDPSQHGQSEMSRRMLLEVVKWDVLNDVCGNQPLLNLNYMWIAALSLTQFSHLEEVLTMIRNPLFLGIYNSKLTPGRKKRTHLISAVMREMDEQCMRIMATCFQQQASDLQHYKYWLGGLTELTERLKEQEKTPQARGTFHSRESTSSKGNTQPGHAHEDVNIQEASAC